MCWNTHEEIRAKLKNCSPNELRSIGSVINDLLEEIEEAEYDVRAVSSSEDVQDG
jgi:hypothetical protein